MSIDEQTALDHGLSRFDASAHESVPSGEGGGPGAGAQEIAQAGLAGGGGPVPHLEQIQRAFGRHDLSGVRAHVGGAAAAAADGLGAEAYASGDQIAFAAQPDLFLAAHEAAHVVQQRGGVQLSGGVGRDGDEHERHADDVATAVLRGDSAEPLLDRYRGGGGAAAIQRNPRPLAPRTLTREFEVPESYDEFRAAVEQWLATQVMSRTEVSTDDGGQAPARREHDLVEHSNLRRLHQQILEMGDGRPVPIRAHLVPGQNRYERVEFDIRGMTMLDPTRIEGGPSRSRAQLERRLGQLEAELRQARREIACGQVLGDLDARIDRLRRDISGAEDLITDMTDECSDAYSCMGAGAAAMRQQARIARMREDLERLQAERRRANDRLQCDQPRG